jgi:hypothetical protein
MSGPRIATRSAGAWRAAPITAAAIAALAATACGDHGGPATPGIVTTAATTVSHASCGGATPYAITPLAGITLDCSSATTVAIAGGSATYLVAAQLATDGATLQPVSYTLTASGAGVSQAAAPPASLAAAAGNATRTDVVHTRDLRAQRAFDARLRDSARVALASGTWRRSSGTLGSAPRAERGARLAAVAAIPTLNSVRAFRVLSSSLTGRSAFTTVGARLAYVGDNVLVYVDTLAPTGGFSQTQIAAFGRLFDQTLYPIDVTAFGAPSDVDSNGHLIMLLTPVVNGLVTRAECNRGGFVAGFFDGIDLASTSANSNQGEIFYGLVPDPAGRVSCAHSLDEVDQTIPATFLHELQHLINFSQHVIAHGGQEEVGWLDEGMSIVAEELGAVYYEQRFPPPSGRSTAGQLFPDSAQGVVQGFLPDSYTYLLLPDTAAVTLHSDADDGTAWRGSDWLLLRWLGDHEGAGFYQKLEKSTLTGAANVAAAAGEPFPAIFGDFAVSLYTDSVPGVAKSSVPTRYRFQTRTLRAMYQRLFSDDPRDFPRAFPIAPTALRGTVTATMVPGTTSFYLLTTTGTAATTLRLTAPNGGAVSQALHPQLTVVRLP